VTYTKDNCSNKFILIMNMQKSFKKRKIELLEL